MTSDQQAAAAARRRTTPVSPTNTTSAPMLSQFLPGSISGVGLDPRRQLEERDDRAGEGHRADEHADEHLGVVDAVGAREPEAQRLGAVRPALDAAGSRPSRPAPRPGRRSCATARSAPACRSSRRPWRGTGRSRRRSTTATTSSTTPSALMPSCAASTMVATSATAMPAMPKKLPGPGGLVLGQAGQREDEQQRRDEVGGVGRGIHAHVRLSSSRTSRACGGSPRSRRRC